MAITVSSSPILGPHFGDPDMTAAVSAEALTRHMLRFEAALARVEGDLGVVDAGLADTLATGIEGLEVDADLLSTLGQGTCAAGVPVPALVAAIRNRITGPEADVLHWGATSQDVIDTAHVLAYRDALGIIEGRLALVIDALAGQAQAHATLPMAGRTRGQVATPISFGLRIAQWAAPLIALENDLPGLRDRLLAIQFGGASGANSAVAPHGPAITQGLAQALDLRPTPQWHTNRTGPMALAHFCLDLGNALAKLGGDLILMGRSEIAEAKAGLGGGSSTMPQKSNPVQSEALITLSHLIGGHHATMASGAVQAEERDGATWPVEWLVMPQMLEATAASLRHALALAQTIAPNAEIMRKTLLSQDGIMAEAASFHLATSMPRAQAQALVKQAVQEGPDLTTALDRLVPDAGPWAEVLNPDAQVGAAACVVKDVLATRRKI